MPPKKRASKRLSKKAAEKLCDHLHKCGLDSSGASETSCDGSVPSCRTRKPRKRHTTKRGPARSYRDPGSPSPSPSPSPSSSSDSEPTSPTSDGETGSTLAEDRQKDGKGCTSSDDPATDHDSSSPDSISNSQSDGTDSSTAGSSRTTSFSSRSRSTGSSITESSSHSYSTSDSEISSETLSSESEDGRMGKFSATFCICSASSTEDLASPCVSPSRKTTRKVISNNNTRMNSGVGKNQRSSVVNRREFTPSPPN